MKTMDREPVICDRSLSLSVFGTIPSLHMQKAPHRTMNATPNTEVALLYRKRPEPCRVVSLATLRRTNASTRPHSRPELVSNTGVVSTTDSWLPMPHSVTPVNVSPSSWKGLHDRVRASRATPTVVA